MVESTTQSFSLVSAAQFHLLVLTTFETMIDISGVFTTLQNQWSSLYTTSGDTETEHEKNIKQAIDEELGIQHGLDIVLSNHEQAGRYSHCNLAFILFFHRVLLFVNKLTFYNLNQIQIFIMGMEQVPLAKL